LLWLGQALDSGLNVGQIPLICQGLALNPGLSVSQIPLIFQGLALNPGLSVSQISLICQEVALQGALICSPARFNKHLISSSRTRGSLHQGEFLGQGGGDLRLGVSAGRR
jgi:hypothetical protein